MLIVLLYRSTIAAFCTGSIIWSAVHHPGVTWLVYLTNWSFLLVAVYFICSVIVTAIHLKNEYQQRRNTEQRDPNRENCFKMAGPETSAGTCEPRDNLMNSPLDDAETFSKNNAPEASRDVPMSWFHEAVWVIYNIASTAAILVTIVYWVVFGGASPISVVFHALNSVLMVCDTMLSSVPVRLFHVVYPVLYFIAYIMLTVIYWAYGGIIYPLTDYTGRPVLATVSLVCLFFIGLSLVPEYVVWLL